MARPRFLVYGIGVNDADYKVCHTVNGKKIVCPLYQTWQSMLRRCYSAKYQAESPTYIGCSVTPEWLTFSNFKRWMISQDWQGKELDKDLLVKGNKVYSPDTSVFVDRMTNAFTTDSSATRGEWPIGVNFHKTYGKLRARCRNPFTRQHELLGYFTCHKQAHLAWKKRKHELACQLADLQSDERVSQALRARYAV